MSVIYDRLCFKVSRLVTKNYSTSFSMAVGLLEPETRNAIHAIYGFVRIADEIVDTFNTHDRRALLEMFEKDYNDACERGISTNPVLHSFQSVMRKYSIPDELVRAFLRSMKADLSKTEYSSRKEMNDYIYGSADVVGLLCLRVFVSGDDVRYEALKKEAMKLGSAFQKVNFLRDLGSDLGMLQRRYFPEMENGILTEENKNTIIKDIEEDLSASYVGIKNLPSDARRAVLAAYYYYGTLLKKIARTPAERIISTRIRISNFTKVLLLLKAYLLSALNMM